VNHSPRGTRSRTMTCMIFLCPPLFPILVDCWKVSGYIYDVVVLIFYIIDFSAIVHCELVCIFVGNNSSFLVHVDSNRPSMSPTFGHGPDDQSTSEASRSIPRKSLEGSRPHSREGDNNRRHSAKRDNIAQPKTSSGVVPLSQSESSNFRRSPSPRNANDCGHSSKSSTDASIPQGKEKPAVENLIDAVFAQPRHVESSRNSLNKSLSTKNQQGDALVTEEPDKAVKCPVFPVIQDPSSSSASIPSSDPGSVRPEETDSFLADLMKELQKPLPLHLRRFPAPCLPSIFEQSCEDSLSRSRASSSLSNITTNTKTSGNEKSTAPLPSTSQTQGLSIQSNIRKKDSKSDLTKLPSSIPGPKKVVKSAEPSIKSLPTTKTSDSNAWNTFVDGPGITFSEIEAEHQRQHFTDSWDAFDEVMDQSLPPKEWELQEFEELASQNKSLEKGPGNNSPCYTSFENAKRILDHDEEERGQFCKSGNSSFSSCGRNSVELPHGGLLSMTQYFKNGSSFPVNNQANESSMFVDASQIFYETINKSESFGGSKTLTPKAGGSGYKISTEIGGTPLILKSEDRKTKTLAKYLMGEESNGIGQASLMEYVLDLCKRRSSVGVVENVLQLEAESQVFTSNPVPEPSTSTHESQKNFSEKEETTVKPFKTLDPVKKKESISCRISADSNESNSQNTKVVKPSSSTISARSGNSRSSSDVSQKLNCKDELSERDKTVGVKRSHEDCFRTQGEKKQAEDRVLISRNVKRHSQGTTGISAASTASASTKGPSGTMRPPIVKPKPLREKGVDQLPPMKKVQDYERSILLSEPGKAFHDDLDTTLNGFDQFKNHLHKPMAQNVTTNSNPSASDENKLPISTSAFAHIQSVTPGPPVGRVKRPSVGSLRKTTTSPPERPYDSRTKILNLRTPIPSNPVQMDTNHSTPIATETASLQLVKSMRYDQQQRTVLESGLRSNGEKVEFVPESKHCSKSQWPVAKEDAATQSTPGISKSRPKTEPTHSRAIGGPGVRESRSSQQGLRFKFYRFRCTFWVFAL
jgi:hypothetical protein